MSDDQQGEPAGPGLYWPAETVPYVPMLPMSRQAGRAPVAPLPPAPSDQVEALATASSMKASPQLTLQTLFEWASDPGLSKGEAEDRAGVYQQILATQPTAPALNQRIIIQSSLYLRDYRHLKGLPAGLVVRGNLCLDGCVSLEELSEGGRVEGSLSIRDCVRLKRVRANSSVGRDFSSKGCIDLTDFGVGTSIGGSAFIRGCTGLTGVLHKFTVGGVFDTLGVFELPAMLETIKLGAGKLFLAALRQGHQQGGPCNIGNLVFSDTADSALAGLPQSEHFAAVRVLQQLSSDKIHLSEFEDVAQAVLKLPAAERAALPDLCAPLRKNLAGTKVASRYDNMVSALCYTRASQRPRQVRRFILQVVAQEAGANPRSGVLETKARTAVGALWESEAGLQARSSDSKATYDDIIAFIKMMQKDRPTDSTQNSDWEQLDLDRALRTVIVLNKNRSFFSLNIETNQTIFLKDLVGMAWNLIGAIRKSSNEQMREKHIHLKANMVAALSRSLIEKNGEAYCSQGVVLHLFSILQECYSNVHLSSFFPPPEGDFVGKFVRELKPMLEHPAPNLDRIELMRLKVDEAVRRAEALFAPNIDGLNSGDIAAETKLAKARVAVIEQEIDDYITFTEVL